MAACYFFQGGSVVKNTNNTACVEGTNVQCWRGRLSMRHWQPAYGDSGVTEYCMSNNLCAYRFQDTDGSGYYQSGCTDPTGQDPNCPQNCTSYPILDMVYDYSDNQWRCCGGNGSGKGCSEPLGAGIDNGAPAPIDLEYIATIVAPNSFIPLQSKILPLSGSNSAAATSARATSGLATPAAQTSAAASGAASPSTGLSPGAAAGIAIAALLGVEAVLGIGYWILRRRKKHGSYDQTAGTNPGIYVSGQAKEEPKDPSSAVRRRLELDGAVPSSPRELD